MSTKTNVFLQKGSLVILENGLKLVLYENHAKITMMMLIYYFMLLFISPYKVTYFVVRWPQGGRRT